MKISPKFWSIVGTLVVLTALVTYPEIRYRRALPRFRLGLSTKAIERECGSHLELRKNGNYLPETASDYEKRVHLSYDTHVQSAFVCLGFNDFRDLIRVTKMTPLAKVHRWLISNAEEDEITRQVEQYREILRTNYPPPVTRVN